MTPRTTPEPTPTPDTMSAETEVRESREAGGFGVGIGAALVALAAAFAFLWHLPYTGFATFNVGVTIVALGLSMWRPDRKQLSFQYVRETVPFGAVGMVLMTLGLVLQCGLSVLVLLHENPFIGVTGVAVWGLAAFASMKDTFDELRERAAARWGAADGHVWEQPPDDPSSPDKPQALTEGPIDDVDLEPGPDDTSVDVAAEQWPGYPGRGEAR